MRLPRFSSPALRARRPERRPPIWAAAALAGLLGCGDAQTTQLAVTIAGDPSVMQQLRRVEVKIYPTDLPETTAPVSHLFSLPASSAAAPIEPLSFGVRRGRSDNVEIVVEGFADADPRSASIVERKVFARFAAEQTRTLSVYLAAECLNLSSPCRSLQTTCRRAARACAAVEEQPTTAHPAGPDAPGENQGAQKGTDACAAQCRLPDYLCTPTNVAGYTCLGQFADWPMPDGSPAAKVAPRYDDSTTPGLVHDLVTDLFWQRDLPTRYVGCTGSQPALPQPGSTCSWDEAKIYCSELTLGGRRFRVPSKIELESLVDLALSMPPFDTRLFPGNAAVPLWTSSPVVDSLGDDAVHAWIVAWPGATQFQPTDKSGLVRCVSGIPTVAGTPTQRYIDEGNGVVRDARTNLAWQRSVGPVLTSAVEAARHCQGLGGGFRIPTYKELLTLVDPTRHGPAIDPIFSDTPNAAFWSEPSARPTSAGPLVVHFLNGASYPLALGQRLTATVDLRDPRVRCVR